MDVALKYLERLAAEIAKRGEGEAAVLVDELIAFTVLEGTYGRDTPRDKGSHRKKSCTGKRQLNEAQSVQQAEELNKGLSSWMSQMVSYACLYCGHWHVGTDNPEMLRYNVDEPMTDMDMIYERVWLGVQTPTWLLENPGGHWSSMGQLLRLLFEDFGWEIPHRPGRAEKMIARFKAEFVEETGGCDVQEDAA